MATIESSGRRGTNRLPAHLPTSKTIEKRGSKNVTKIKGVN